MSGVSDDIKQFARGDETAYQDWVDKHHGYVLAQRSDGFMLHEASCNHLGLVPGKFALTNRGRRWAESPELLVRWTEQTTGTPPLRCRHCM